MDYVLISDFARYVYVVAGLLIIATWARVLRLRVKRVGWTGPEYPTPLGGIGIMLLIALAIARRFDGLGEPGDAYLWVGLVALACILLGSLMSIRPGLSDR